jgi:type II secretory pathway pseudopilin PulG
VHRRSTARRRQGGVVYLLLIFIVALSGVLLAGFGQVWATSVRREKEAQLLHVGHAYRAAILSYYNASPAENKQYPQKLEDLILDKRFPDVRRHLRKVFPDPFSGKADWELITEQGAIVGIRSRSQKKPIKQAGFDKDDADFDKAASYNEWRFIGR